MGDQSKIEWTDATWNPIVGCSIVSPGCTNCYAMKMAARIEAMSDGQHGAIVGERGIGRSHYTGTTKPSKAGPVWTGKLALAPEQTITAPLRWKKPRMIFVNSMGDLFHEDCPDEWIDQLFAVMALAPKHTFQVLTKRAARMRSYLSLAEHEDSDWIERVGDHAVRLSGSPCAAGTVEDIDWPLSNVWLGVSTEDQKRVEERVPHLLETPAAVRFISAEPLLGPLNLEFISGLFGSALDARELKRIHWVIAGGESGPKARPMHPDWARSLRDQCEAAGVPFFFKQWGEWLADSQRMGVELPNNGHGIKVGKRKAGRLLDGIEHNGMPEMRR